MSVELTTRDHIIADANNLCDGLSSVETEARSSKFERAADRELVAALSILIGHGMQDDFGYDEDDTCWERVDRWICAETDDGFWLDWEFVNVAEAEAKMAELIVEGDDE